MVDVNVANLAATLPRLGDGASFRPSAGGEGLVWRSLSRNKPFRAQRPMRRSIPGSMLYRRLVSGMPEEVLIRAV